MYDSSNFFGSTAEVGATIISITFAIFAIYLSSGGRLADGRVELKYTIKYWFVEAAFLAVVPSLVALAIINYLLQGDEIKMVLPFNETVFLTLPVSETVLCFQVFVLGLLILAITRIVTRAYYIILQNEPVLEDLIKNHYFNTDISLYTYEEKRYNTNSIKKKVYKRLDKNEDLSFALGEIITALCNSPQKQSFFFSMETLKINKSELKKIFSRKERRLLKKIKPKIQTPNQIMMICLDELFKTKWNDERVTLKLTILVHEYLRYAHGQQNETRKNICRHKKRSL
jgi:hypothetical protein